MKFTGRICSKPQSSSSLHLRIWLDWLNCGVQQSQSNPSAYASIASAWLAQPALYTWARSSQSLLPSWVYVLAIRTSMQLIT